MNLVPDVFWAIFYDGTDDLRFNWNGADRAFINNVNGAYVMLSDARLKKDVQSLDSVLDGVLQLRPASYQYLDNTSDDPRSLGFIAQEVGEIFPNLVRESNGSKRSPMMIFLFWPSRLYRNNRN